MSSLEMHVPNPEVVSQPFSHVLSDYSLPCEHFSSLKLALSALRLEVFVIGDGAACSWICFLYVFDV